MRITKYEIDMLNVKNADAFLIHFFDDDNQEEYIVLVDAGNYSDGATISKFIKEHYKQQYIDLAICSHCDKDHFGGFLYLIEQMQKNVKGHIRINEIWVNDPADHIELSEVKWIRKESTKNVRARSVFDINDKNLLDELDKTSIRWYEPFSDASQHANRPYKCMAFDNHLEVIGPSVNYYESLVLDFRNDLQRISYDTAIEDDNTIAIREIKNASKTLKEAVPDPSSHNKSSVIVLFKPDNGKKFLFTGDASKDSFSHLFYESDYNQIRNIYWLKIPHHGSKHNLDSNLIAYLKPKVAYVSSEKYGHYLSKAVVNELDRYGCSVYSTNKNGHMWHHCNTTDRSGYSPAEKL